MSKLRSYIIGLLIITSFSNTLLAQKFQTSLTALSLDFNRETNWNPFDPDLEFPSAVGLTVSFPTSQYLSFGANLKYGTVKKATDDLIRELNGEQLFSFSGASRLQKIHSRYMVNPFLQFAVGGQSISQEDGIKAIVNLGMGTDIRLYKKLNFHVTTSFTREVSRNRYFIDYGVGLTWAIHDGSPQLDRIQDEYVEERNDFDGDGLADVDDDCPDLAGTVASGGCPDMDEDGVPDVRDLCPEEAGLIGNDGCPLYTGTDSISQELENTEMVDSDGDGVVDAEDLCPDQYGNLQNSGCPEPDSDNDGVVDRDDLCPDTPGSIDNSGCPDDFDISALLSTNPTEMDDPTSESEEVNEKTNVSPEDLPSVDEEGDKLGNVPELAHEENKSEGLEPLDRTKGFDGESTMDVSVSNEEILKEEQPGMPPKGVKELPNESAEITRDKTADPKNVEVPSNSEVDSTSISDGVDIVNEELEMKMDTMTDRVSRVVDVDSTLTQAGNTGEDDAANQPVKEIIDSNDEGKEVVIITKTAPFEDRDGDGIANHIDPCPDIFGTLSNKGCPDNNDEAESELGQDKSPAVSMDYLSEVRFEPGLASIERKYIPVMDEIAAYMQDNPELQLEIFGHTDSQGPDQLNDVLSERRAKACYIYLRVKGVPSDRMTYTGLGEHQPKVVSNSYLDMASNRRVVFRFRG